MRYGIACSVSSMHLDPALETSSPRLDHRLKIFHGQSAG
jgi:hypothetical protein